MITYEMIIDITIIVLLIPTIAFLHKLSKNLNIVTENQSSLSHLVNSLNDAAIKAETAIPQLKSATSFSAEELEKAAENASKTKEELKFLIERAENLAGRLENVIYSSRYPHNQTNDREIFNSVLKSDEKSVLEELEDNHSEAEMELLQALRSIK